MVGRGGANGEQSFIILSIKFYEYLYLFKDASRQQSSDGGQWVSSGQRTRGGTFSGTVEGGIAEHDQYSSEYERRRWERSSVPPQVYHHMERDNVPTDRPDLNRHRGKRQV